MSYNDFVWVILGVFLYSKCGVKYYRLKGKADRLKTRTNYKGAKRSSSSEKDFLERCLEAALENLCFTGYILSPIC